MTSQDGAGSSIDSNDVTASRVELLEYSDTSLPDINRSQLYFSTELRRSVSLYIEGAFKNEIVALYAGRPMRLK